ncbi:MAG: hypothetical protein Q8M08_04680 [Bacteroidales bacterium]|nr:hypothetical protein [Bacteroidales bacterium]
MKRSATFTALFFMFVPAFCQIMLNDTTIGSGDGLFQPKKYEYGITLGSQFTAVSGFGSALNSYITPSFSYNLNKRLRVGGGVSVIRTNYFQARSFFQNEQALGSNGNFTNAVVFINGQYIVNERITISGTAYKQVPFSKDPLPYNPFSPVSSRQAQGINFEVGYKVGDHMFIQAGFRYSEGNNPYYADPFNRNVFQNYPFGRQRGFGIGGN